MSATRTVIRIVVADDHPIVRKGLCRIVEAAPDLEVVGEAATAEEAIAIADRIPCDVVVLDLGLPGAVGFSVLRLMREHHPNTPVLILSVAPENQYGVRAIKAGASGYLTKRTAPEDLVNAIRHVVRGGLYVSAEIGQQLAREALRPVVGRSRSPMLSERELDVLRLIASGASGIAIAMALEVCPQTVSTYKRRLLRKLGLHSQTALIRYTLDERIIDI